MPNEVSSLSQCLCRAIDSHSGEYTCKRGATAISEGTAQQGPLANQYCLASTVVPYPKEGNCDKRTCA